MKIRKKGILFFLLVSIMLIFLSGKMVLAREAIFLNRNEQTVENQQENVGQSNTGEMGDGMKEPATDGLNTSHGTDADEKKINMPQEGPMEVLSWKWTGDALQWSDENKRWELAFPGASKEQLVSRDVLKAHLPETIRAELNAGEQEIVLNWELDGWPESAYEGEYAVKACLPEGYTMGVNAGDLEVAVILGGAMTEGVNDTFDDLSFEGVTPKGTTINAFDYWQWERNTPDNTDHNPVRVGINGGKRSETGDHALLFRKKFQNGQGEQNQWTGTAEVRQGMVLPVLENGFPQLEENGESLAYLFDGNENVGDTRNNGQGGKKAFMNVGGLLQVDDEGYYYYDCQKNYAYFNEETKKFQLYNQAGVKMVSTGNVGTYGQFFPFTKPGVVFDRSGNEITKKDMDANNAALNHYFGLSMTTRFVQQDGGEINQNDGEKPVTYEFSGDDDVWVFIDDVLVADLGGIHDAASVKIDFSTGTIVINEGKKVNGESIEQTTTLKEQFQKAEREDSVKWSEKQGNTFADGSYHTLKFFYLERGNSESNMSLKYNLVTVPESDIIKVDQLDDPVAGAAFTLYAADKDYQIRQEGGKDQVIATGTTDENGTFVLVDEEGFIVSLKDLKNKGINHFILRETKVPEGYRFAGDVKLYLDTGGNGDILLLCDNSWESGSYASPKLTVSTDSKVTDINGASHDLSSGTMFAVVLKYKGEGNIGDHDNWQVVYGDPMTGWKIAPADMANVLTAARDNPYVFGLDSSGSYKAELENMPGDIKTYYFMLPETGRDQVKYIVNYYYTKADSLESATTQNTVRLENDEEDYTREFSARLYVPNVQNRLLVQKFAEDGVTPVTGATFALYEEKNIQVEPDGSYTIPAGSMPYSEVTTADLSKENGDGINLDGGGVLPTKTQVEQGKKGLITGETYYLVETSAPMGYKVNPKAVQVMVDNSGIYADAGDKMDGISVARGVGSVVKSMIQFVAEDEIDTTLHDIKVKQQTSDRYPVGEDGWRLQDEPELHLQYDAEEAALEYKPMELSDGTMTSDRLVVDQGWSKLKIQQCLEHSNQKYKQDLGETDLTNLFSRTAIVQVTNQRVGSLKIEKHVTGDFPPTDSAFQFNLTLKDKDDRPLDVEGEKHCGGGKTEKVQIENGMGTFTLKTGEWVSFTELPAGAKFTVNETEVPAAYAPSITVDGQPANVQENNGVTGTIEQSTESKPVTTVTFTNAYNGDVQTDIQGQKTLVGRNLEIDDVFTFVLEPEDDATSQAIENGKVLLGETSKEVKGADTQSTQSFEFSPITFKTEGHYTFNVKEKLPDNLTGNRDEQYVYDAHTAVVQVDVERDPKTQKLQATRTYDNTAALTEADREISKAAFTNTIMADFQFTKINREGTPLSGATFGLYQLECQKAEHHHDQGKIEVNADGAPIGSSAGCWKQVDKVSSEASGVISFSKLPVDGIYRLVELKAPDGYGLPNGQWKVVYEQTGFTIPQDSAVGNPPAVQEAEGIYKIPNDPPVELPLSGSQGTTMFLAVGAVLMLAGMTEILLFKNRRKS